MLELRGNAGFDFVWLHIWNRMNHISIYKYAYALIDEIKVEISTKVSTWGNPPQSPSRRNDELVGQDQSWEFKKMNKMANMSFFRPIGSLINC